MQCPSCSAEVASRDTACTRCGATMEVSVPTREGMPAPATPRRASGDAASAPRSDPGGSSRFPPGTVIAGRYRIAGPLGKGGMGEVYRADDLRLDQPVALKFLSAALGDDPARLARFHTEVRVAREVTHPNVCRVHDIGEADGLPFISMEYVDGEDLSSLLRRIGRLPRDKGLEIAHQLCAGLAAAHDRGVLHRDLKPANVMIDGRGRARITDFGLASLADQIARDDMSSGTPAYMAPEQFAGREVSVRSDVYALGLVLYEVFTGKRPFEAKSLADMARAHQSTPPPSPSDIAPDIDPVLERTILRCLEKDPRARPPSAVAVAAALPGGDPLAAARAAGVTPSPEMVAAAGEKGGLRPAVAWALLGGFVLGAALVFTFHFQARLSLVQRLSLERPPQVLADRARQVLTALGTPASPADRDWAFQYDKDVLRHVTQHEKALDRWDRLASGQPAAVYFWYRESPRVLVPNNRGGVVTEDNPAPSLPGMAAVRLDTSGRLNRLHVVPPEHEPPGPPASQTAPAWPALFTAAGLDLAAFRMVPPQRVPPVWGDARAAWDGVSPERPDVLVHVEAATYRGRPVFFEVSGPWRTQVAIPAGGFNAYIVLSAALLASVGLLAYRNLRLGRGDRRGALRLFAFSLLLGLVRWVPSANHVGTLAEWTMFTRFVAWSLWDGAVLWLYYMALEPYVRRLWPELLVSWSRLLSGHVRDPLIGRDVLVGSLCGLAMLVWGGLVQYLPVWLGQAPRVSSHADLDALLGGGYLVSGACDMVNFALHAGFLYMALLIVLRIVLRRSWAVATAFILVMLGSSLGLLDAWFGALYATDVLFAGVAAITYWTLTRVGLLGMMAALMPIAAGLVFPMVAFDLSAWHASTFLTALSMLVAMAGYAFHISLAGRPKFEIRDEM